MKALRILVVAAVLVMSTSIAAQWLKHPTADIPRTADGKADLAAPAPRQANGKPVLAGLWRPAPGLVGDMTRGMKKGEVVPFQPWAEALFKERRANNSRDDPTARCVVGGVPRSDFVGYPFKILERPEHGRHPVRGGARLSADLHRRTVAAQRSESRLVWLLGGALGGRRPRRRIERLQRQRLAGQRRAAGHRAA